MILTPYRAILQYLLYHSYCSAISKTRTREVSVLRSRVWCVVCGVTRSDNLRTKYFSKQWIVIFIICWSHQPSDIIYFCSPWLVLGCRAANEPLRSCTIMIHEEGPYKGQHPFLLTFAPVTQFQVYLLWV